MWIIILVLRNTSTYLEHIEFEPLLPFLTNRNFRSYIFLAAHKGLCTFQDLKCEILYARAIDVWCGQSVCVRAQSWGCSRLDTLPSRGSTADVGLVGRVWLLQTRYSGLHGHRLPQHLNGSLIIFSFVTYENMCFMYFFYVLIDLIFFIPEITWSVFL